MSLNQRRADRPKSPRVRANVRVENLETRQLMAADPFSYYKIQAYNPPIGKGRGAIHNYPSQLATPSALRTENLGKLITGKDREGDEYVIKVTGPGYAIVTDATPNDGALDDDLHTIQLVGTDPNKTNVTAQVIASARLVTDGTIKFQKLIAQKGVHSIKLNGFTLTQTVTPADGTPNYSDTGINLAGGVGHLQFHNIVGTFDEAAGDVPIRVVVGNPGTALKRAPSIQIDSVFNTALNSSLSTQTVGVPKTTPTVSIEVNGQLRSLDMISSTAQPVIAGQQSNFSPVAITGRTAVRAVGIDKVNVAGSAKNVTFSRGAVNARRAPVGLKNFGTGTFGGNADGVAIYSAGRVDKVRFNRGLGNPNGTSKAGTAVGTPLNELGYPAYGLLGGLIVASQIGGVAAYPANTTQVLPVDPDFRQLERNGATTYVYGNGSALTNAAIVSQDSIGHVNIVGNSVNSEIKTGFDYPSYVAGLEPTRSASSIGSIDQNGDLVDSVNSATYRPIDKIYGNGNDRAGNGSIKGRTGRAFVNGGQTALGNTGSGNYAKVKVGKLTPKGPKR